MASEGATQTMATADDELQYFVGREDELQALRNFVADPSPGVLLVTGPPGISKLYYAAAGWSLLLYRPYATWLQLRSVIVSPAE